MPVYKFSLPHLPLPPSLVLLLLSGSSAQLCPFTLCLLYHGQPNDRFVVQVSLEVGRGSALEHNRDNLLLVDSPHVNILG